MKRIKKGIKIFFITLFGLMAVLIVTIGIGKIVNAQKYKIRSESGVQESKYITIGGIDQYIQIRGEDTSNPIVIMLHGGPGSNMAFYSYYWQKELEQSYTVVHWDQRGSGNTYYHNKGKAEAPTLDLLLSDLDELVDYLCTEYGKEDVIIFGHSWGTVLGGIYAGKYPEKLSHYVAVGQMVNAWQGEEKAVDEAIRLANEMSKPDAAQEIKTKFEQIITNQNLDMLGFMEFRGLTGVYLPAGDAMSAMEQITMGVFSPYMTWNDLRWYLLPAFNFEKYAEPNYNLYQTLFSGDGLSMYDYTIQYEIPVTCIMGDCDWITPYIIVEDYFDTISAPEKELIYMTNAGHTPFLDKPEEFAGILLGVLEK